MVFTIDEAGAFLDDGDLAAESAKHLTELETDVTAADDDEMRRRGVQRQHRAVGEIRHLVQALERRSRGTSADVDEDSFSPQSTGSDEHLVRGGESCVSGEDRAPVECPKAVFESIPRPAGDRVLPRLDLRHVDADRAIDHHAEISGPSRHVCRIGAGDHRLGRNASGVHAGAAEQMALDDGDAHAGGSETPRQRRPGLSGADDDGVECLVHPLSSCVLEIAAARRERTRHAAWPSRRLTGREDSSNAGAGGWGSGLGTGARALEVPGCRSPSPEPQPPVIISARSGRSERRRRRSGRASIRPRSRARPSSSGSAARRSAGSRPRQTARTKSRSRRSVRPPEPHASRPETATEIQWPPPGARQSSHPGCGRQWPTPAAPRCPLRNSEG